MRAFIAIPLASALKQQLVGKTSLLKNVRGTKIRWLNNEHLHLTLKFLGEASELQVDSIVNNLAAIAKKIPRHSFNLSTFGCFPSRGQVRIIWAGVSEIPAELLAVYEAIESFCGTLGWKMEERSFHPHVTLGRVKEDYSKGELRSAVSQLSIDSTAQCVDAIYLYRSILHSAGARYEVVYQVSLNGG